MSEKNPKRFVDKAENLEYSQCLDCRYWFNKGKCNAFPKGIPDEILKNEFIHDKIHPNQKGDFIYQLRE